MLWIGFKEANIACCGSGPFRGTNSCGGKRLSNKYELCENVSEYVFFDGGHTTEKANEHLANLMWSGTPNIAGPYNLKALFELWRQINVNFIRIEWIIYVIINIFFKKKDKHESFFFFFRMNLWTYFILSYYTPHTLE